jgi:tetratricopeptide (TPR) repeat protein
MANASPLSFADHLFKQGNFCAASTEYQRVLFQEAACHTDSLYAAKMLMMALYHQSDLETLVKLSESKDQLFLRTDLASRYAGVALIKEGYYVPALRTVNNAKDPKAKLIRGLSLEYLGQSRDARSQFQELLETEDVTANMAKELLQLQQEMIKPHSPSPLLAGLLGIIPGAGYAATGRFETALASLVLNGALFVSSAELKKHGLFWSSGIVFSVFSGFYLGNIFGSAAAAAQDRAVYKTQKLDDYIKRNLDAILEVPGSTP